MYPLSFWVFFQIYFGKDSKVTLVILRFIIFVIRQLFKN